ncbi:MAG: xanthine dehydrogenase family protein subunit M [Acidobacteria bacterium]|nr:MAG: xanthine dehydrogenase family protein subunit M [Acidobacteriota bacterium]
MRSFDLVEPATLGEAVKLLDPQDKSVRAIAGGTALMLMMKTRLFQPTRLISLRRLDGELRGIRTNESSGLRIGAMTSLAEMEYSPMLADAYPVMSRALRTLSNIRIRNVATLGGHLAHGDPHMDLPPILLTLGAKVSAVSSRGQRWISVSDLLVGYYQTSLAKDELITAVDVPGQPHGVCCWYEKFTARSADDWPTVGAAVWYTVDSNVITEARVAVSAATERPMRMAAAEELLVSAAPTPQVFSKAADAAAGEVQPLTDLHGSASYKREMVRVHVRRALERAFDSRSNGAE